MRLRVKRRYRLEWRPLTLRTSLRPSGLEAIRTNSGLVDVRRAEGRNFLPAVVPREGQDGRAQTDWPSLGRAPAKALIPMIS